MHWIYKAHGLNFVRFVLSEPFFTCLKLCFTWFNCNSNFSTWSGAYGSYVLLSFIFERCNHSFIHIAAVSSYSSACLFYIEWGIYHSNTLMQWRGKQSWYDSGGLDKQRHRMQSGEVPAWVRSCLWGSPNISKWLMVS